MDFYNNHIKLRGNSQEHSHQQPSKHRITLQAGQVHEVSHWMAFKGDIDLSELTFEAKPVLGKDISTRIQSFVDIAVFEVPEQCTSETCDISKYGVGKLDTFNAKSFVNMCENGRLRIDTSLFRGFHTQLMVPSEGPMPRHVKRASVALPRKDQTYDVVFANCNDNGRQVLVSGQAVLDYDENQVDLNSASVFTLTAIALCICLLFTLLTVRIHQGTRSEYNEYQRMRTNGH